MKVGFIGLPEVGKTTLFNALTRSNAATHSYGAHSAEANLGSVVVPDERFDFAVEACAPKKRVPASIEVTDGGARIELHDRGEKFGTDFFVSVRNMDALVLVLRAFPDGTVPAPAVGINPRRDAERLIEELALADMTIIEGRLERLEKNRVLKRITPAESAEQQVLARILSHVEGGGTVRSLDLTEDELKTVRSFAFVSGKPLVLVANIGEQDLGATTPELAALEEYGRSLGVPVIALCAEIEMEVSQMDPADEAEFLSAMGISDPARSQLIRACYEALGYMSFFTVGEDEVRAWTIRRGTTALGCAATIHTDIARTFIRAEVMAFDDFREAGNWDAAKSAGKMRLEGKEYVVHDGDIVHIRNSRG